MFLNMKLTGTILSIVKQQYMYAHQNFTVNFVRQQLLKPLQRSTRHCFVYMRIYQTAGSLQIEDNQMGKSNKKVKSERINAIRKQYDAFLEEDKKRKDRNEYILERLDKIRTSSAIVQVRNGLKDYFPSANQNQSIYERKDYMEKILPVYEKSKYCFNSLNNPNLFTSSDEQVVLKEISKKYILIPRHTNIFEFNDNYPIKSNFDDNSDWRNKYKILDELKQNEKETDQKTNLDPNNDLVKENINSDKLLDYTIKESNFQNQINDSRDSSLKLDEKSLEKHQDNLRETASIEQVNVNTNDQNDTFSIKTEIVKQPIDNLENITNLDKPHEIETQARNTDIENKHTSLNSPQSIPIKKENIDFCDELVNENVLNTDDLTEKEKLQAEMEINLKPKEDVHFEEVQYSNSNIENQNIAESSSINYQDDKSNIDVNEEENSPINLRKDEEIKNENEPLTVVNTNYMENKNDMQEVQEVNIQNENMENQIESQEVPEVVHVNPGEPELEDNNHESQIKEFEAEQSEMFYSDPNVTEYAYDQTGNIGENYPNEDYVQNENYVYYEGAPQEQVYSGEINDHEESTEQYDPHYEEQYGNYEQQEQINPTTQLYEAEEIGSQPQVYEQVQFEGPDTNIVKEVEGQLDAEENYINTINEDANIEDIIDEAIRPEGQVVENQVPAPIA